MVGELFSKLTIINRETCGELHIWHFRQIKGLPVAWEYITRSHINTTSSANRRRRKKRHKRLPWIIPGLTRIRACSDEKGPREFQHPWPRRPRHEPANPPHGHDRICR